jgi:hypothetical protein
MINLEEIRYRFLNIIHVITILYYIILFTIFTEIGCRFVASFLVFRLQSVVGFCGHGNENSGSQIRWKMTWPTK